MEPINFLPPAPLEPHVRTRRYAFFGVVCLFLFVGIGLVVMKPSSPESQEVSEVVAVVPNISAVSDVVGGDIHVPPPSPVVALPVLEGTLPSVTDFTATHMVVKDHKTGVVLFEKDPYTEWPLASITKLMSALVLLERPLDMTSSTAVVSDALIDTHMYAGDTYTLEELWQAALIGSSNKAIVTLVDVSGWQRETFVERMNQKALELGMGDTHFVEPTGLDAKNTSTAVDVSILLSEALRYDDIRDIVLSRELTLYSFERENEHHLWNTNWLLLGWIPYDGFILRGAKTGYIPRSRYNFTVQVEDTDGHIIDVVVLGAEAHEARFTEARDIAKAVFEAYRWPSS